MRFNPARFARFCERHGIDRKALVLLLVFLWGHPEQRWVSAALDFTRGEGPAAVAAGRSRGQR